MDLFYRSVIFGSYHWWEADIHRESWTMMRAAHAKLGAELRHATMREF